VKLIIEISGSKAGIRFDRSKPNGQPRRNCDTRKATEKIGFVAKVSLREGLKKTIEWYKK
jgi:GDP-L-fucose synthase